MGLLEQKRNHQIVNNFVQSRHRSRCVRLCCCFCKMHSFMSAFASSELIIVFVVLCFFVVVQWLATAFSLYKNDRFPAIDSFMYGSIHTRHPQPSPNELPNFPEVLRQIIKKTYFTAVLHSEQSRGSVYQGFSFWQRR